MSLKYKIKQQISEIVLKRKQLADKIPSGKIVDISTAKSVLFFSCSSADELLLIQAFLQKQSYNILIETVLVYCDFMVDEDEKTPDKIKIITQNDFGVFGKIKQSLNSWLRSNNYNLLISFAVGNNLFCNKIISDINADFKASNYSQDNVYLFDLTIKQKAKEYNKQIEQFIFYINNLNINI